MPQTRPIKPFIEQVIIEKMKAAFGDRFKAYYFGDPISVPKLSLPCMVVSKESGQTELGPTGHDEVTSKILIQVMQDKSQDYGRQSKDTSSLYKLRELLEGRDATSGEFLPDSVIGVIRKNFTLGNIVLDEVCETDYVVVMRPEQVMTEEAHVRIEVTELVQVSNRV